MPGIGKLILELAQLGAVVLAEQRPPRLEVVQRLEPMDVLLHAFRQAAIGGAHAGKKRVAARLGNDLGAQDGAERRRLAERLVGMPDVGKRRRIVGRVVEDDHFGPVGEIGREGMDRKLAEQRPERHLLVDGDVLVAHHDHLVSDEGIVDDPELRRGKRPAQVEAFDLRPNEAVDRMHADGRFRCRTNRRRTSRHGIPPESRR
jgi:hypothetical protein